MGSSPENIYHGQEKPEAAITDASLVTQLPPEKERSSTAKDVESLAQGTPAENLDGAVHPEDAAERRRRRCVLQDLLHKQRGKV
ncbi:MAG: hypothetical protein Q9205_003616 [Flavoplaca limonia]